MGNPMDDALEAIEKSQARPTAVTMVRAAPDWFQFRRKHADLWIASTGQDGCKEEWQELLRSEGATRLDNAILRIRRLLPKGNKINLSAVLAELQPESVPESKSDDLASMRSRVDLLIWCVVHSPTCYADARCRWVDGEGQTQRTVTIAGQPVTISIRERQCVDGLTAWEKLRDRAKVSQDFIFSELGKPCDARNKPAVYQTVKNDPRWIGYLRAQRLIP